jgi:hypothetical protein
MVHGTLQQLCGVNCDLTVLCLHEQGVPDYVKLLSRLHLPTVLVAT